MSTRTIYSVRSNGRGSGTWSVWSSEHPTDSPHDAAIPGSSRHIMTCPTPIEAARQARLLQNPDPTATD